MATVPVAKKPGPPVPPRPQNTALIVTTLKTHRLDKKTGAAAAEQQLVNPVNTKTNVDGEDHNAANWIAAKGGNSSGRTVIYKSPSVSKQHRQEERSRPTDKGFVGQNKKKSTNYECVNVPKAKLKLRKAPDVPTLQLRQTSQSIQLRLKDNQKAGVNDIKLNNNNNNNDVIVQSTQIGVTRHHSINSNQIRQPSGSDDDSTIGQHRKYARFSLSNVVNTNIHLNKLQPTTHPLLKPRKIDKIPIASLDVEDDNHTPTTTSHLTGISMFRRSKTTLDQFTSRAHVTNISTGHQITSGSFFSGKTVEITNNLRNAAERLFSEIIINQEKSNHNSNNLTTEHERALQHQQLFREKQQHVATPSKITAHQQQLQQRMGTNNNVTVVNTEKMTTTTPTKMPDLISEVATLPSKQYGNNCTRINITATNGNGLSQVLSAYNSPEKKAAFHEILISELTAMRKKSSSMENLGTTYCTNNAMAPESKTITTKIKTTPYHLSPSLDDNGKDVEVDNIEDMDGDQEDNLLHKSNNILNKKELHKRSPSGCSSDSSPYGTERSARIRTSDWIEVGDNGKKVTLTSCHISLEDSGLEDEERLDDISSSGVGDSWDSVKEETEVETKRNGIAKGIINTIDLPPLPKSLNGTDQILGLEYGLINNVDTIAAAITTMSVEKNSITSRNDLIMKNVKKNNNNYSNGTSRPIEMAEDENQNHNYINNNDNDRNKLFTTFTTPAICTNYDNSKTLVTAAVITKALHEINDKSLTTISDVPPAIPGSKLDNQIATLRKEMFGLRQLDISLLSQLWALNDSIQEFRAMIQNQDQEEDEPSLIHSHSPSPYDSVSSEGEDEVITLNAKKLMDKRLTPPSVITKQPRLKKIYSVDEIERLTKGTTELTLNKQQQQQNPVTNLSEIKPMPRMRSAPPPPPTQYRKSQPAPARPT